MEFPTAEYERDLRAIRCVGQELVAGCSRLPDLELHGSKRAITDLRQVQPVVAAYIERLTMGRSVPTVKQHLAPIGGLFDGLVTDHVLETNPSQ